MLIETLITDLSKNPFDPQLNYEIAQAYENIGQTASAISFYLRTAEYGDHSDYVYCSLIKAAQCFETQQNRQATVENLIYKAIAHDPNRPEGYFWLARFYDRSKKWQECYTFAQIGLHASDQAPLFDDLGYDPLYLIFEKAVSAWWIGRKDESIKDFNYLLTKDIPTNYRQAIESNLARIQ